MTDASRPNLEELKRLAKEAENKAAKKTSGKKKKSKAMTKINFTNIEDGETTDEDLEHLP